MKILAIGNSFSSDATRYLYGVARAAGVKLKVANLYIGGCSLYRHYRNMLSGDAAYSFELNGASSGLFVSLERALLSDEWDVVTLQQSSHYSPHEETFEPFLSELAAYVRRYAPKAKLYIHQTWAYESGCPRLMNMAKVETAEEMLGRLTRNYERAAITVDADGIIPCGDAMYRFERELRPMGYAVHRDTYHASLGAGRYLLALVWLKVLCGVDPTENSFRDFDVAVPEDVALLAGRIAAEAVDGFGTLEV